jgi:hypothetical protein
LAATGHGDPQAPQSSTDEERSTHSSLQSVGAVGGHSSVHPNWPDVGVGAQYGVVAPQVTLHPPQWSGSERLVSQPAAAPEQSA